MFRTTIAIQTLVDWAVTGVVIKSLLSQ